MLIRFIIFLIGAIALLGLEEVDCLKVGILKRPVRPGRPRTPAKHAPFVPNSEFIYSAFAHRIIQPRSKYLMRLSIERANAPVDFELRLMKDNNNETIAKTSVELQPESSSTLILSVESLPDELYNLTLKATMVGSKKSYTDFSLVYTDPKIFSILVQTDKPVYKPSETIKFRVLFLDRDLKPKKPPKDSKIKINIYDSQNNIVKTWAGDAAKMITNNYGLIKQSLLLSKEPNLGEWSIQVTAGDESHTKAFSVDQYVLPKFKVELKTSPTFVTYNNTEFNIELCATYTHGKGVKSQCTVIIKPTVELYDYHAPQVQEIDSNGNVISMTPMNKKRQVKRTIESHDGKENIHFDLRNDLKVKPEEATEWGTEFSIHASCTDLTSGRIQNGTGTIKLYKHGFTISSVNSPANYKPGFPLTLTIKVATHDDLPVVDSNPEALKISHGFAYNVEDGVIFKPIPPNGLVSVTFTPPTNDHININGFEVSYKGLNQYIGVPQRLNAIMKSYMVVSLAESKPLVVGSSAEIVVEMNKPFSFVHCIVIVKGHILRWERMTLSEDLKIQKLKISITKTMAPVATLLIYTILPQADDIVADTIKLNVQAPSNQTLKLNIAGDKDNVEPGTNITINCIGTKQALVALRGVDQSVLLLKEDQDITSSSLKNVEDSFEQSLSASRNWGGSDAFQVFETSGLVIMSNALISKQEYPVYRRGNFGYGGGGFHHKMMMRPMAMASLESDAVAFAAPMARIANVQNNIMMDDSSAGHGPSPPALRVRKDFPETWIFTELLLDGSDGIANLQKTVPDTITSWMISGFQISPKEGLSVALSSPKLTVFRPFFIVLNLPYSVVKGEIFNLQVLVYNYMDSEVEVEVTLDNSEKSFQFVEQEGQHDKDSIHRVTASGHSTSIVSYFITPKKIGTITLNVKAIATGADQSSGDMVSQPLIVKAPGVKQSQNNAVFLNLLGKESSVSAGNLSAVFPANRIEGGDTLKVIVSGDILGGTLSNLESLIQLPYGCGEQNMINFVPNIVVLDYLKITQALTDDIKVKAIRYMESGYQRELTFKRYDGSFSTFGNSDKAGSTWLTAFVVRSFIQAKRYIAIDRQMISLALEFLNRQQLENGSFLEQGILHDSSILQGAGTSKSNYALTAYVLLTYVEALKVGILNASSILRDESNAIGVNYFDIADTEWNGNEPSPNLKKFDVVVNTGVNYLIKEKDKMTDTYSIILTTYLLHLMNHEKKDEFFEKMESHAVTVSKQGGGGREFKFWQQKLPNQDPEMITPHWMFWSPWIHRMKPASIEMTAYALLTHLLREKNANFGDCVKIAGWLMKQRNSEGGFQSTQDTVVGITALGKFAEKTYTPDYHMEISVDGGDSAKYTFHISKENVTTLGEYFLPENVNSVDIRALGTGSALAQLSWTYYTMNNDTDSGFALDVSMEAKDKNRRLELDVCTFYTPQGRSNMAILEINSPTGYAFDAEELINLKKSSNNIKRHETSDGDTKLHIYFDYLTSKQICVKVITRRIHLVAKYSKSSVQVYDYYDTTRKVQRFYEGPEVDVCQICSLDDSCKMKKCAR